MEAVKVSIIVPVYKVPEKYLRKCIESCITQSLKDIEIVLVDDGSPDNCGKICDEYALNDKRIKVIHKKNGGLCAARNSGVKISTGEWITFLDGDDWIEKKMCQEMFEIGNRNNTQIVICGIMKDYSHKSIRYKYYLKEGKIYENEECLEIQKQLLMYNANMGAAYSKLIKREILIENNIFHDEKLKQGAEGLEFTLRLFEKVKSVVFIDKPFYHYIYNENSISASHDEKNHLYVINCFNKIKLFIENSINKKELMPWFYNRLLYVIITTAISGYFNPNNKEPYNEKVRKYKQYLNIDLVKKTLTYYNVKDLSKSRRFILYLIRNKKFFLLNIMGHLRKWQKCVK